MNRWNRRFFKKFEFEALTFDDVTLRPLRSRILPSEVNLETRLSRNIPLNAPLVSADMDTVTEYDMAIELAKQGGIGFLWKDPSIENQENNVDRVKYAFNARIDNPVCINENQTLGEVAELLGKYDHRFSSLIVLDSNGKVVGLLTKDKTQFSIRNSEKVRDFMIRNPITTGRSFNLHQAYDFMRKSQVAKLILVNPDGTPKGLYCWKDVEDIVEKMTPTYNRDKRGQLRVGANVGVMGKTREEKKRFYERVERLLLRHCDVILVGTAHGDSDNVINTVRELKRYFSRRYDFDVIAGNVATAEGAKDLCEAGADGVKVGVGPGSICTTRVISGCGIPQITAVYEASSVAARFGVPVNSDGGIKFSGDIPKALGAGASSIMIGSLFAATEESPGEIIIHKGKKYKEYRGMGSLGAMKDSQDAAERYGQKKVPKDKLVSEGIEGRVPLRGSVGEVIFQLMGGLRAGMGYLGAMSIEEVHKRARFMRVSNAGLRESHPHDVEIITEAPNYKG